MWLTLRVTWSNWVGSLWMILSNWLCYIPTWDLKPSRNCVYWKFYLSLQTKRHDDLCISLLKTMNYSPSPLPHPKELTPATLKCPSPTPYPLCSKPSVVEFMETKNGIILIWQAQNFKEIFCIVLRISVCKEILHKK